MQSNVNQNQRKTGRLILLHRTYSILWRKSPLSYLYLQWKWKGPPIHYHKSIAFWVLILTIISDTGLAGSTNIHSASFNCLPLVRMTSEVKCCSTNHNHDNDTCDHYAGNDCAVWKRTSHINTTWEWTKQKSRILTASKMQVRVITSYLHELLV